MTNHDAKPFLKWAGGKGQLVAEIKSHLPKSLLEGKITTYVEPFVGGGAVFFALTKEYAFSKVYLNDVNEEIILTYKVIQNSALDLINELSIMQQKYLSLPYEGRELLFYEVRKEFNAEKASVDYNTYSSQWISHAAKVIFLNKTCFNGLYRLNSSGMFNVPFGKYRNPTICDKENILCVHYALKRVTLLTGDFEKTTEYINDECLVYMDPPYRPLNTSSSFNDYSKESFNDDSQRRLAKWYAELDGRNASLMLSNSDPTNTDPDDDFFQVLYKGFEIKTVMATRAINSNAEKRGQIRELLITNYQSK
jgi:DNA adenine methylase